MANTEAVDQNTLFDLKSQAIWLTKSPSFICKSVPDSGFNLACRRATAGLSAESCRSIPGSVALHSLQQNCRPVVPVNGTPIYAIAAVFAATGSHVREALKHAQEH